MSIFINKIRDIITSDLRKNYQSYKFNYFEDYNTNITDENYSTIVKSINENSFIIDGTIIREIKFFLSEDISNQSSVINDKKLVNYIIFSLFMYIYDYKINKKYIEDKTEIFIKERIRPDKLLAEVINTENDDILDCYVKVKLNFPSLLEFNKKINTLLDNKFPIPFCKNFNDITVYEVGNKLNILKDPLNEVIKDIVNQLKNINKYYWFQYFDKKSIGRSNYGLKRYFIFFLEGLIEKDSKITSHNTYDGRKNYTEIGHKDQIRTLLHILSEIYVFGNEDYRVKIKKKPFSEYIDFITGTDDDYSIYDKFILYLMGIKNESTI